MNYIISYKWYSHQKDRWYYKKNVSVSEEELDVILSDPECVILN